MIQTKNVLLKAGMFATMVAASFSLEAAPWDKIESFQGQATYLSVVHFNGKYVATAGSGHGYWESNDGITFEKKDVSTSSYYESVVLGDTLALYGYSAVLLSKDLQSFSYNNLTDMDGYTIGLARSGDTFYAATDRGLWVSTDGGTTWAGAAGNSQLPDYFGNKSVRSMTAWDDKVLVGTASGVWLTTNKGETFTSVSSGIDTSGVNGRIEDLVKSGDYLYIVAGPNTTLYRASVSDFQWEKLQDKQAGSYYVVDDKGALWRYKGTIQKSIDGINWSDVFIFGENNASHPYRFMLAGEHAYFCSRSGSDVFREYRTNLNAPGELIFHSSYPISDGWYWDVNMGFFWTGAYPWIYTPAMGWTFIHGPNENGYFAFHPDFGWYFTWKDFFPYIYVFQNGEGYHVDMSGTHPDTVYRRDRDNAQVGLADVGKLEVNFESFAGKTITLTDSIGTHTAVLNSFGNADDRGDLTFKINNVTYTFSITQLTYSVTTQPQINLQAVASVGDTAPGSNVLVTLYFTSANGGTTNYGGYTILEGLSPKIGGTGVKGTFKIE